MERPITAFGYLHKISDRVADIERTKDVSQHLILASATLLYLVRIEDNISSRASGSVAVIKSFSRGKGQLNSTTLRAQAIDTINQRKMEVLFRNDINALSIS